MKIRNIAGLGILACFSTFSAVPARAATVLYSNLGPGNSYNPGVGWTIMGPAGAESYAQFALFTPTAGGDVAQIDVALRTVAGNGSAVVSLWTESGGLPGVLLGSWFVTSTVNFGGCCDVTSATGITGVTLTGGQSYALLLDTFGSNWLAWNFNNQGVVGEMGHSKDGGGSWTTRQDYLGAFAVYAGDETAVPEPSTLLLAGVGLIGLFAWRTRR